MKKLLFLSIVLLLPLSIVAKKSYIEIEIKEGNGAGYKGVPKSKYTRVFPYVCYKRRIRVNIDGEMFLKYKGCIRTDVSCQSLGMAHFGRYPNDYESYKALKRCINSTPRFID